MRVFLNLLGFSKKKILTKKKIKTGNPLGKKKMGRGLKRRVFARDSIGVY
jgi:hypothetical protein